MRVNGDRGGQLTIAQHLEQAIALLEEALGHAVLEGQLGFTDLGNAIRFSTVYSVRKMLVKPRLGKRRCSGIWPPSKPRIRLEPEREPWPLWPRVEVLPMPEPIPRPTRLLVGVRLLGRP